MFKLILDLLFPPRCLICRAAGPEVFCGKCLAAIEYLKSAEREVFIAKYAGKIKRAIKLLKFKKKKALAAPLGELCLRYVKADEIDLIIPVPLHVSRLQTRGFNQCYLIGKVISEKLKIAISAEVLCRTRKTASQFGLKKLERLQNIRGAFAVENASKVAGKRILLLDDIYTTGATLRECQRVLMQARAFKVSVLTLCKVL